MHVTAAPLALGGAQALPVERDRPRHAVLRVTAAPLALGGEQGVGLRGHLQHRILAGELAVEHRVEIVTDDRTDIAPLRDTRDPRVGELPALDDVLPPLGKTGYLQFGEPL